MKTKLKSIITAAFALAMSFITSSALAATTPIVSVNGTTVTVKNTENNAGGYSWTGNFAATLTVPATLPLTTSTQLKLKSFTFWSRGTVSNNSYADTVTITVDDKAYTTSQYTGNTADNGELVYAFPAGSEPVVTAGTTYSLSFALRSGPTGLRYRAAAQGSGSDGFFKIGTNNDYAPELLLTAEIYTPGPTPLVMWDDDFASETKNGFTLSVRGGEEISTDKSYVEIKSSGKADAGLSIIKSDNTNIGENATGSIIFKVSNLPSSIANAFLISLRNSGKNDPVGIFLDNSTSGVLKPALISGGNKTSTRGTEFNNDSGTHKFVVVRASTSTLNFYEIVNGEIVTLATFTGTNTNPNPFSGFVLGGMWAGSADGIVSATGMKIEAVAVFSDVLTGEQAAAYKFPSDNAPAVPRIISINITNANTTDVNTDIQTLASDDLIPAGGWINVGYPAVNGERKGSTSTVKYAKGTETGTISGATFAWTSAGTSFQNMLNSIGSSITFMKDAYCRGSGASLEGSTFTLTGVPYKDYDVIVYISGKTANVDKSITVNGTAYYGGEVNDAHPYGTYIGDSTSWGSVNAPSTLVMGQNAIRVTDQTDSTLVISTPNPFGGNWGVAAIQVIERFVEGPTKATATLPQEGFVGTWSSIQWDDGVAPSADVAAEITITGDNVVSIMQYDEADAITAKGISFKGTGGAKLMLSSALEYNGGKITSEIPLTLDCSTSVNIDATSDVTYYYREAGTIAPAIACSGAFKIGSGNITLSSATIDKLTGTMVIDSGAVATVNATFSKALDRKLLGMTSGNGTLKIPVNNNGIDVHNPGDTPVTANVNVDYTGTGTLKFVGSTGDNDKFIVAAGKTVTFNNGTLWPQRNTFEINGNMFAKYINIGHDAGGNYPGKIFIKENGTLKTESITFKNAGGNDTEANRSVLDIQAGGTLELTGSGTAIAKTSGAKNTVKFNGGTVIANESSWTTDALNLTFVDGTTTTFEVASGKEITLNGTATGSGAITKTGAGMLNLPAGYTSAITLSGGMIPRTATNTVKIDGEIDLGATEMPLSWTLDAASTGTLKLPEGFPFGEIAKANAAPANLTVTDSDGKMVAVELDGEYLVLPKSEIVTPYNVIEPTEINGDLTFGDGGSINITHSGAMLKATGTIALPANGLPVTFVCENEYELGTQVAVVTAAAFKLGENDATLENFTCTLTGKLPKGMAGEFKLVESEGKQALVFAITKSDYYTAEVASILEGENLLVRFEADRGISKDENGNVTQWDDISGNNVSATPYAIGGQTVKPVFVAGDAHDYVDFGAVGSKKDLQWTRTAGVKTLVIAMDIADDWNAFILGDTANGSFHRKYDSATAGAYADSREISAYNTVRDNGTVVADFNNTKMPTGFRVTSITMKDNASIGAARFTQDRAQGEGRTGGKKLCEVMLFDRVLTDAELATVEGYLTSKWKLALKNTVTINGTKNWRALGWAAGKFYADAPTEITLDGNARLVYDTTAPIGNITFNKGAYTLEQVITSATGLSGDFTVPAGETFVFKGGETSAATFTYANKVTVNGTLKTEGYVDLSYGSGATGNIANSGATVEIVNGYTKAKFGNCGMKGTLTIDADAKFASYGYVDAVDYNGTTTVNVYGTLDFTSIDNNQRWTLKNDNTMNFYTGSSIIGVGQDSNRGALQAEGDACVWNFKKKAGDTTGTINFSAALRPVHPFTMNVEEGVTVNMGGSLADRYNPFTLTGKGTINLTSAYDFNAPVTISEGTTLVIDGGSFAGGYTNNGTIELKNGSLNLGSARSLGTLKTAAGTTLAFASSLAEDGEFSFVLAEGSELPTVTLDGVTIENPTFENNTITFTYTPSVKGEACWMDYEFDGNLTNVGSDKTGLARDQDGGKYIYGNPTTNDFRCVGKDDEGNDIFDALYAGSHPYRSANWPANFSCAMFGTLPEHSQSCLFAFGSTTDGSNKGGIALMTGDVAKNEVLLVKWTDDAPYETMATMSVPNAYTASHLYIFVKEGKTVKVYLDGMIWTTYTSETDFKMGTGFQICSVHGGTNPYGREDGGTCINRFYPGVFEDGLDDPRSYTCVIESLRLYNGVIGENAIAELKKEFKYVSPNGNAEREVATTDGTWVQDNAWTLTKDGEVSTAAQPLAGSALTLVAEATDAALTVNLEGAVSYEAVTINGTEEATLTIKSDTGSVINAGQTTINVPLTIEAGAMTIFGGPTFIKGSGSVTFDYTDYDFQSAIADDAGFIQLTGILDAAEKDLVTVELPDNDKYFTLNAAYDTASTTYRINYTRKTTEVTIPEVAGATPSVEGYTISDAGTITVKNGDGFTIVYTANEGKLFTDGESTKSFEFTDVTEVPTIDISGVETTAAEPTATVVKMEPTPDGLADAATFTAGEESKLYAEWNADFIFSADQDIPQGAITLVAILGGEQVSLEFTSDYTAGTQISVLEMIPGIGDWKVAYPELVEMQNFSCGLKVNKLLKPTAITIDLVLTKDGEDAKTLATYQTSSFLPTVVEVMIPTIDGANAPTVMVGDETIEIIENVATVLYGGTFTVTYTAPEGKTFKDADGEFVKELEFEYENVMEDPVIADDIAGIEIYNEPKPISDGSGVVVATDDKGDLVVSGSGATPDYGEDEATPFTPAQKLTTKEVVIGEGVTKIGARFFKDFKKLNTVKVGKNVASFGEKAFYKCLSLEEIVIENEGSLSSLENAVVYRIALKSDGTPYMIPSIKVAGYKEMLYGKVDLTDPDWTPIGALADQNLETLKQEGRYHFFQVRLVEKTEE